MTYPGPVQSQASRSSSANSSLAEHDARSTHVRSESPPLNIDESLPDWATLAEREWPTALLGNGLSINLWRGFQYVSLFNDADFTVEARGVFDELDTTNFETVLECVHHARLVAQALREPTDVVDQLYAGVRDTLFETVVSAHVAWDHFPEEAHRAIAHELNGFRSVFTTNYDLCLYWSQLQEGRQVDLVDFMWNSGWTFAPSNVEVRSGRATPIYYLHGAVHLWQDEAGLNGKWTSADSGNLLDLASKYPADSGRRPLFVSEGTSKAKVRSIQRSAYLAFCRDTLTENESNTLVFGHSLSDTDRHVIDALDAGRPRTIAVSLFPSGDPKEVIETKARILRSLDRHKVFFFDSTTHPLGAATLQIRDGAGARSNTWTR